MGAIFQSLGRTVTAGVVLLIVLVAIVVGITGTPVRVDHAWTTFFMRWLHVLSGVMWIGLLWYFNFVQIPSMPKIPDEHKPAIGKVIAPDRAVLVPLGRARDRGYRRIARRDDGLFGAGIDATNSSCRDRYRHVACADHGV